MARILVIDDEPNIRMMIRMALGATTNKIEEAEDGISALEKFGDGSGWNLCLLDQRMPGMEGIEVLRQMKTLAPHVNVVFMTAYGSLDLALDTMEAGATDFLRKPFTLEVLRRAVDAVLNHHSVSVHGAAGDASDTRLGFVTLNGYHLEPLREASKRKNGEVRQMVAIQSPNGNLTPCEVVFPADLVENIRGHIAPSEWPVTDRFWHGLAEEMLAHHIWQNAEVPMGGCLRRHDYEQYLEHWLNAVTGEGLSKA